jgi:hypothetical protein
MSLKKRRLPQTTKQLRVRPALLEAEAKVASRSDGAKGSITAAAQNLGFVLTVLSEAPISNMMGPYLGQSLSSVCQRGQRSG